MNKQNTKLNFDPTHQSNAKPSTNSLQIQKSFQVYINSVHYCIVETLLHSESQFHKNNKFEITKQSQHYSLGDNNLTFDKCIVLFIYIGW